MKSKASRTEGKSAKSQEKKRWSTPARGERGGFYKVTITLPPDMLAALKKLGIERKLKGMKDTDVSSLIREAVSALLSK